MVHGVVAHFCQCRVGQALDLGLAVGQPRGLMLLPHGDFATALCNALGRQQAQPKALQPQAAGLPSPRAALRKQ